MNEDAHLLPSIKNEVLDTYLSFGWYRGGRLIFTTHTLEPYRDGIKFRVFWLRYLVAKVHFSSTIKKLIKLNKRFTVSCRTFSITDELTELHQKYLAGITFETAQSLKDLLQDTDNTVYSSYLLEVRDNGILIAAGVFDRGLETIAGIVNFYDHAYSKFSPGRYLIILKYLFCVQNNIPYYYPGYFSPQYPAFDYKLFLDKSATEVYLPEINAWHPYNQVFSVGENSGTEGA